MAKNDLVSLALISNEPKHAYALNTIIREMRLEHWAKISPASIYNALARLEKEGCIAVTVEKVGNMPDRKVYAITAKGAERLRKELNEAILSPSLGENPFYLAINFAFGVPWQELTGTLKKRADELSCILDHLKEHYAQVKAHKAHNAMIGIKAGMKHVSVEIDTTRELIDLIEKDPQAYEQHMKQLFKQMQNRE